MVPRTRRSSLVLVDSVYDREKITFGRISGPSALPTLISAGEPRLQRRNESTRPAAEQSAKLFEVEGKAYNCKNSMMEHQRRLKSSHTSDNDSDIAPRRDDFKVVESIS